MPSESNVANFHARKSGRCPNLKLKDPEVQHIILSIVNQILVKIRILIMCV